jgi:MSHA pilin protein MshD
MSTNRQRGVTMIELLVFIVIVSIAVAGVLGVISLTTRDSADPLRRKQALLIAESLMEEVQMAQFTSFDPASMDSGAAPVPEDWGQGSLEPGQGRPFDNVNDYVSQPGVAETPFNNGGSALRNANGDPFVPSDYQASVSISPATLNGIGSAGTSADTEVLHIRVTVTFDGDSIVLDGYRTRYAP